MNDLISKLLLARNVAHTLHWGTLSFSQHLALGELYDALNEFADELAEMYMGSFGAEGFRPSPSIENTFSVEPLTFVQQLYGYLSDVHDFLPQAPELVNKFEELQGVVSKAKYKLERLK